VQQISRTSETVYYKFGSRKRREEILFRSSSERERK